MADLFEARDRSTGKVVEFTREFLDAWSGDYFILGPVEGSKIPKPSVRAASTAPVKGVNPEGGA